MIFINIILVFFLNLIIIIILINIFSYSKVKE